MPRSTAALKPASSRPFTSRRNHHHSDNHSAAAHCKAGLPVSSLSASLDISVSMAPSSSAPAPLASTAAAPKSSAASSSSSPLSSDDQPCSSSSSLQDTLYEYVKGLQDAIKVPDADLAERLLEEIGNALSLPSAVSLVISANGARLIASCVKHFRNGMQKPLKVASKLGRSSFSSKVSSPKSEEYDPGGVVAAAEVQPCTLSEEPAPSQESQMDDLLLPRKRQRTVGDLDDEDEFFRGEHFGSGTAMASGDKEVATSADTGRRTVKLRGRGSRVNRIGGSSDVDGSSRNKNDADSLETGAVTTPVVNGCWAKHEVLSGSTLSIGEDRLDEGRTQEPKLEADESVTQTDDGNTSGDEENDSVYLLAKASGMSSVVATACSGLDKLLNAALQIKKSGSKAKAGASGVGRRCKSLSAEMYVALTEAFVDMVQVLKDNVDLLSWCLNCLGAILPPGSLDRTSFDAAAMNSIAPLFSAKETIIEDEGSTKIDGSDAKQHAATVQAHAACAEQSLLDQKLFPSKALLKLATKYRDHTSAADFTLKIGGKSSSGSYVAAARSISTGKSSKGVLPSTFCSGITSESTSSSISALAAVAYAATVPMLAEKAVKAVLSAMQACDIESHSTLAALRALSAHLSSTTAKPTCDDAFAFIIAAMREFVSDAEMQAESCIALGSLTRAVTSTTGHAAWAAITISMEHHQTNLAVQRAGCGALQVLCTRTGLGVPEWRTGKRPVRASRDSDREAGARALISSMSSFPDDVRIQWHGCCTLWTLVHSAGVKGVAKMVKYGAVSAVVGAMSVCRMNEMMQQEGCNVIGTMVRTLAENGHEIGLFLPSDKTEVPPSVAVDDDEALEKRSFGTTDWWTALGAVVSAMKMFNKSKSLQSNGTFALGCILKGSGEAASLYSSASDIFPLPGVPGTESSLKKDVSKAEGVASSKSFSGKDIVDNVEKISAAVEVTMAAMREFSKVETVQVWGCAVLQQAFLAYVHYARCLAPVSEALLADAEPNVDKAAAVTSAKAVSDSPKPSPSDTLARLILSQATSAMCMISRTMALCYNSSPGASQSSAKTTSAQPARGKTLACSRSQAATSQFFSSVRQSWCAALGAIGDVFGYLTRNSEVAIGKAGFTSTECMDFFRSNKSFFDRSSCHATLHLDLKGCDDDRSESEDGVQSEKNTELKDVDLKLKDEEVTAKKPGHSFCSAWIDWAGFGVSQQQAVKDIKAWQEATESMAKIAENVGFPLSVKNAILSIRTIFYKLEDAETVIWACHALVSLYLTWENLHLFKPGIEVDREEYKAKIWGEGEAGVKQLVDLVVHWTNQNRPDVTSLALQALYGACVFAATVKEIEKVFSLGGPGPDAVLGAMQKALSSGSAQHRRKVVQQGCCVLATVCGYSIRAQVAVASHGGSDLILTALDRYTEDNQIQVNGLHALGVDSLLASDFDAIWNSAISKTSTGTSKSGRRKRGNQSSTSVVSLSHIFREGVNYPAARDSSAAEDNSNTESSYMKGKWNPHFEKLVLDGAVQIGLLRTAILVAPGCGGPIFAIELLRRLGGNTSQTQSVAELQAHVCFVIGYMAEHDATWRKNYLDAGALDAVLKCMSTIYSWKQTIFTHFSVLEDDTELDIKTDVAAGKNNFNDLALVGLDARIQCSAAWAVGGLLKDLPSRVTQTTKALMQGLIVALHRYGGLQRVESFDLRPKKPHPEVSVPARLALSKLGVFRIATESEAVFLVHEAAETGDVACLKSLAESGADIFVPDSDGKTGEWHAELLGQTQVVAFFKEQIHLQGKKKAKEKAKAKSKQGRKKAAVAPLKEPEASARNVEEAVLEPPKEATINSAADSDIASIADTPISEPGELAEECVGPDEASTSTVRQDKGSQKSSRSKKKDGKIKTTPIHDDASFTGDLDTPDTGLPKEEQKENHWNAALHDAMASGDVDKMEAAIKACEEEGRIVDERLLKTVKGALAKRLKRREKGNALEDELSTAIQDGDLSRLELAIAAVESVPRFATALREKLASAKELLRDLGGGQEETPQENADILAVEKVEEKFEIEPEIIVPEEVVLEDGDDDWISQKGRRRKEKENLESTQNTRGKRGQRQRKQKAGNVRQPAPGSTGQSPPPALYRSSSAASYMQSVPELYHRPPPSGQDLPPLLPTPRSSFRQPRSVIMPPKAAATQASTSTFCEHNPITPQLFPSRRSPLICDPDLGGDLAGLANPSSWSSPKSCSSLEDDAYRLQSSRWGSRSSTPVEDYNYGFDAWSDTPSGSPGYITALLATLFPVERLPSSSTTLFSASLGEFPAPSVAEGPRYTSSASSSAVPTPTVLGPVLPDDSDLLSFLDSSSAAGGDSLTDFRPRSRPPPYAPSMGYQSSLFSEENPYRMGTLSTGAAAAAAGKAPSLHARLQAALLEATLEDSCCICFDMPKDAALVPCGHRMCKSCAEQIQCVRERCPICNRCIDAVLALYG